MEINISKSIFVFVLLSIFNTIWYLLLPRDKFHEDNWMFRERKWENQGLFYNKVFKVKKWKDILPELGDFLPTAFKKKDVLSFDMEYVKEFIAETCRAEICHWSIIFSILLYFLFQFNWVNAIMVIISILLNAPFIIIQRYNRPRMAAILKEQDKHNDKSVKVLHKTATGPGKMLFISADSTGNGHKSITEALRYQIKRLDAHMQIKVIDGFSMGNSFFRALSNLYNPIAVKTPLIWGWLYRMANHMTKPINVLCAWIIKKKFLHILEEEQPDIIVSVHAVFAGSVTRIIEKNNLNIPVILFIADLDNVSNLWADPRAKYILCPTVESKESMESLGIPSEKLNVVGFPVREEFCVDIPNMDEEGKEPVNDRISILFINGSQGSGQVLKMAKELLENIDCRITIITGKNEGLKQQLQKELADYPEERVNVTGFTKDIKSLMVEADILVLRASPNVLMEAVNLSKPIIVIGALKGQEEKNPEFIERYQLGCICRNYQNIVGIVNELYSSDRKKLLTLKNNLVHFRNPEVAYNIAEFILQQYNLQINGYESSKEISLGQIIYENIPQQESK